MENLKRQSYPGILQSFGIAGIMIGLSIALGPVTFASGFLGKELATFIYYILVAGITFGIAYTLKIKKTGEKTLSLPVCDGLVIPFIMLVTLALVYGVISPITELIPMPEFVKQAFADVTGEAGIFSFLMLVVAAPVFEELTFRGVMLAGMLERYSPAKSIIISSLLFGIVHLNPWQFVAAFLIGAFAGWIFYRTRSLILCIIIHMTANLNSYLLGLFADEASLNESLLETYGGVTNLVLAIVGSLIIIGGCLVFLKKRFDKQRAENEVLETTQ